MFDFIYSCFAVLCEINHFQNFATLSSLSFRIDPFPQTICICNITSHIPRGCQALSDHLVIIR